MIELVFLKNIEQIYSITELDNSHEYESFSGTTRPPYIIEIAKKKVGCLAFNWGRDLPSGHMQLAYLYVYQYKNGTGTTILTTLCRLADEHKITLFLDAIPQKQELTKLSSYKLKSWYQGFGFRPLNVEGSNYMERQPQPL